MNYLPLDVKATSNQVKKSRRIVVLLKA